MDYKYDWSDYCLAGINILFAALIIYFTLPALLRFAERCS